MRCGVVTLFSSSVSSYVAANTADKPHLGVFSTPPTAKDTVVRYTLVRLMRLSGQTRCDWMVKQMRLRNFDLPLRPGDLIQRHGRILRQGNELWQNDPSFAVDVVVPITRRSLDAWQLGLLHTKQRFITMFRQLDCSVRHYTEQNEVIDFGELSAIVAGDTRILEHVRGTAELRKLEAAKNSWFRGRMMMQDNLRFNANRIASLDARLPAATADASMVASTQRDSLIAVDGLMYGLSQADTLDSVAAATHKNAYTAFAAEYNKHRFNKRAYAALAQYRGMRLVLDRRDSILGGDTFRVQGQGSTYELEAYIKTHSLAGVLNAFVRFTDEMPRMPRHLAELRSKAALEIENIEAEIDKPFAKQGEIDSLIARLRDLEKQLLEDNQSTQEQAQAA